MIEGDLPVRALELIREWIKIHQIELMNIWNTQEFKKIQPLK